MPTKPMDKKERLFRSVKIDTNSGCWNWTLRKDRVRYGRLNVSMGSRSDRKTMSAHRYSFEVFSGPIPEGMNVLHSCDNRACCNPEHLFIGTQKDNMMDMHKKGRGAKGYKRDPLTCSENSKKKLLHRKQHSTDKSMDTN